MKYLPMLTALSIISAPSVAHDDDFIQWSNTSITVLYGTNYDVNPEDQTTFTFEHANGNKWGDFFMFTDYITYRGEEVNDGTYGEISPRFSASKIFKIDASFGIIQDVLLAVTLERGKGDVESLLYGPAIDLKIPYFNFFQLNLYKRDPNNNDTEGWQLTPVWNMTMPFLSSEIIFDGFIDWVFESDNDAYEENIHINPQIKYDLGMTLWGDKYKGKLLVGIEYDYWSNKYGLDDNVPFDVDQNTFSWIIKYHF